MNKILCDSYEDMCRVAADFYTRQLKEKPDSVLGLATGGTMIGLYAELVRRYQEGKIDFSGARSFNLDEYYPIKKSHPQSYDSYMRENLFDKVNFLKTSLPDGEAADPIAECSRYDEELESTGGIDLMLLGIGVNGHIGFNEPAKTYHLGTNLVGLTESTLVANSRFFGPGERQPDQALTMGIGSIFASKKILLLISGASKEQIARKLFEGKLHTDVPACLLLLHHDVTIVIDREANG